MSGFWSFLLSIVLLATTSIMNAAGAASPDWHATPAAQQESAETLIAARKGTRNYQPDFDATPAPKDPQQTKNGANSDFERCMSSWDRDTHMSKDEWKESCKRVLQDRQKPGI